MLGRRALSSTGEAAARTLLYKASKYNSRRILKQTVLGSTSLAAFAAMKLVEMDSPHDFMFWSSVPLVGCGLSLAFLGMNRLSSRDSVAEIHSLTNSSNYSSKQQPPTTFAIRTFTMLGKVNSAGEVLVPAKGLAFHGFGHKPSYFFIRLQDDKRLAKQRILRLDKNETTEKLFAVGKAQAPPSTRGRLPGL